MKSVPTGRNPFPSLQFESAQLLIAIGIQITDADYCHSGNHTECYGNRINGAL